jgi:hypothetical protein
MRNDRIGHMAPHRVAGVSLLISHLPLPLIVGRKIIFVSVSEEILGFEYHYDFTDPFSDFNKTIFSLNLLLIKTFRLVRKLFVKSD